MCTTRVGHMGM
ncbi:hypothetical protein F383_21834 [Gossypium arboreum]|uniref:Uncharacterized protein n=1 Tax=Gossypium arboreum TaxID=29729 RepID=A0A0B0NYF6_GOSAR|nr:hypothetical protein F383_21834 [Gossypium arboreum]